MQGETLFVHDVSSSKSLVRWDCLLVRVVEIKGRNVLNSNGMTVPLGIRDRLLEWVTAEHAKSGLDWPAFLRRNGHRVNRKVLDLSKDFAGTMQVVTAEQDPVVFSKAVYRALDPGALSSALESCPEVESSGPGNFAWFEQTSEAGRRILGTLRLEGDRFTLECMSRQRLQRGRALLEALAPSALRHRRDQFSGLPAAMRTFASSPRAGEPQTVAPEVERELLSRYYEEHYRTWPDTPLPALGGQTPRQAVQSAEGKERVVALLKTFENQAARQQREGEPSYDFSKIKASLGLEF